MGSGLPGTEQAEARVDRRAQDDHRQHVRKEQDECAERIAPLTGCSGDPHDGQRRDERDGDRDARKDVADVAAGHGEGRRQADCGRGHQFDDRWRYPSGHLRVLGEGFELRQGRAERRAQQHDQQRGADDQGGRADQRPHVTGGDRGGDALDRRGQRRDDHRPDHGGRGVADDTCGGDDG